MRPSRAGRLPKAQCSRLSGSSGKPAFTTSKIFLPSFERWRSLRNTISIMKLRGCGTALVTPFKQDGSIDEPALRNLVLWQVESGIDFLVPCGTTGETPTLSHDEWLRVVDLTIDSAEGRVPIMAGATSNNTREAVAKTREISSHPGVDYVLTATPYYNKPTQEGVYQHFRAIAEA